MFNQSKERTTKVVAVNKSMGVTAAACSAQIANGKWSRLPAVREIDMLTQSEQSRESCSG